MQQASLCGLHYFPNPDIVTLAYLKNVASLLRQPLNETGRIWCLELTQRGLTSFLMGLVTA